MRPIRHTDTAPGWINRRFRELERQIRELRAEKRLRATSFDGVVVPTTSLENPVNGGVLSRSVSGFTPTLVGYYVLDAPVTVPDGFDAVVVNVTGRAYAVNSTAADDYLYAAAEVAATGSPVAPAALPAHAGPSGAANEAAFNVSPLSALVMGLAPGEVFNVRLFVRTATSDWAAHADNVADLSGSLTWFRA